ncbi:MAG: hypothetical protein AB2L14_29800 [Candidatus Xenobiia bacterium LiM19]
MSKQWLKLGGLYLNTSKDGRKYFAGYLGNCKICIFKNEDKQGEKDYDYNMMLTERPPKKSDNGSGEQAPARQQEEEVPF